MLTLLFLLCGQLGAEAPVCLDDLERFPTLEVVRLHRERNRHARNVCGQQMAFRACRRVEWSMVHFELEKRDALWANLERARGGGDCDMVYDPLTELQFLRESLGAGRYARGALPPAVPQEWLGLFR